LLCRAGVLATTDMCEAMWPAAATTALRNFQAACKVPEAARTPYILPTDNLNLLVKLCECAGVLFPVPSGKFRAPGLTEWVANAQRKNIPYGWSGAGGADRVAYGLDGSPGYTVFTNTSGEFDLGTVPIAMNCTSFSNLAMSIWRRGDAQAPPYDSS